MTYLDVIVREMLDLELKVVSVSEVVEAKSLDASPKLNVWLMTCSTVGGQSGKRVERRPIVRHDD